MYNHILNFFTHPWKKDYFPIHLLPKDLKKEIFSLLDSIDDIHSLSKVHSEMKEVGEQFLKQKFGVTIPDLILDQQSAKNLCHQKTRLYVYFTGDDSSAYKKAFQLPLKENPVVLGVTIDGIDYQPFFSKEEPCFEFLCHDLELDHLPWGEEDQIKHIILVHLSKAYETTDFRNIFNYSNLIKNDDSKIHINPKTLLFFVLPKQASQQFKQIPLNVIVMEDNEHFEDFYQKVVDRIKEIAALKSFEPQSSLVCNII